MKKWKNNNIVWILYGIALYYIKIVELNLIKLKNKPLEDWFTIIYN